MSGECGEPQSGVWARLPAERRGMAVRLLAGRLTRVVVTGGGADEHSVCAGKQVREPDSAGAH